MDLLTLFGQIQETTALYLAQTAAAETVDGHSGNVNSLRT
jgi:hypothetical protein